MKLRGVLTYNDVLYRCQRRQDRHHISALTLAVGKKLLDYLLLSYLQCKTPICFTSELLSFIHVGNID